MELDYPSAQLCRSDLIYSRSRVHYMKLRRLELLANCGDYLAPIGLITLFVFCPFFSATICPYIRVSHFKLSTLRDGKSTYGA